MKISYIAPVVGACALLAFSSCRSTDADGYAETAVPMSEMEIGDGQMPPWLLEDDGSSGAQVSAGTHTPSVATHGSVDSHAGRSGRASSRQNQPKYAHADDTVVEVDPLMDEQYVPTPAHHPVASHTTTGGGSSHARKTSGSTKTKTSPAKPKRPTMVTYKVRPGDSLSLIASRSNTTVSQIMKDSKLKSTTIRPGQTIKVRYTPKGYKAPAGKGKNAAAGKGKNAGSGGRTHTVTSGQTISGIAARYGVSTSALMKANGLNDASARKLQLGSKLKIPARR